VRLEELQAGDRFEIWNGPRVQWRGQIGHPEYGTTHATLEPDGAVHPIADLQADCDLRKLRIQRL
jgi:hypothetical protein